MIPKCQNERLDAQSSHRLRRRDSRECLDRMTNVKGKDPTPDVGYHPESFVN
jgi:hypothetical protein